jgi:hypothetical protein
LAVNDPDVATATAFLEANGFPVDRKRITVATLMLKHASEPPFVYPAGGPPATSTWVGGLDHYDDSNEQAAAFLAPYGEGSIGAPVGIVSAVDADSGQTLSQWRIEGDDRGPFGIDGNTGTVVLRPGATLDFETKTSYSVDVSVYDGYTRSKPQAVTVNLTNVNDNAPSVTSGQSYRIDGGRNNTVARVAATDADDTNQPGFTQFSGWAITSGNTNSVFRLSGTGDLQVARPLLVDWRRSSYALGTRVSDGANNSAVETVQVTIPNRVNLCLLNAIKLEAPKATAPLLILLGAQLGACK